MAGHTWLRMRASSEGRRSTRSCRAGTGRAAARVARGPLRRVAHLLRADGGHGHRPPRLLGPAVGRSRAPGLHRAPADLVAELAGLRPRGGTPRPLRSPSRLGRDGPCLDLHPPGAAGGRRHAGAPRGGRARTAGRGDSGDRPAGRGRSPLCGRDHSDADRPWGHSSRARRVRLRAGRGAA